MFYLGIDSGTQGTKGVILSGRSGRLLAESYPATELEPRLTQWIDNLLLNSPQAMRASKDLLREVLAAPELLTETEIALASIALRSAEELAAVEAEVLRLTGLEGEELPRQMDRGAWGPLAERLTEGR